MSLLSLSSSPNNKILDWSKFKALQTTKKNVGKKLKTVNRRVENIVEKGENAGYQHVLLFPQCFQKSFYAPISKDRGILFCSCLSVRLSACTNLT